MCAGYLNDHKIQDHILLPGAAMFELCNAACKCLKICAPPSLLHSINLLSPCNVGESKDTTIGNSKVLTCCMNLTIGQMEVRSRDSNGTLKERGYLHLHGWCAWLFSCIQCNSNSKHEDADGLLSRVKQTCFLLRSNRVSDRSHDILQSPSFSSWLQKANARDVASTMGSKNELPSNNAKICNQDVHTSIAIVVDTLPSSCVQPDSYIIHPATLDAATHTAAAFAVVLSQDSNPGMSSCLVARNSIVANVLNLQAMICRSYEDPC